MPTALGAADSLTDRSTNQTFHQPDPTGNRIPDLRSPNAKSGAYQLN